MVTEAAKKKKRTYHSKAKKSNVRASLLTAFHAAIAYACYDSPSLLCGATSMTDAQQYNVLIADLFLGNSETSPDTLCYVDQFLHGLNKFHGLFTTSSIEVQPGVSDDQQPPMLLTLLPILNQQGHAANIFVGKGSIERSLLIGKTVGATVTYDTGRTLLRAAKDVLRSCKKMMSIATASTSPYKDGNFSSGTNWDDFIKWCVLEMKKVMADEKAGMIAKPGLTISQVIATTARTVATTTPAAEEEELEILAVDNASFSDVLDYVADELLVGVDDEFSGPPENAVDDEPDGKFFKSSLLGVSGTIFRLRMTRI